MSQAKAKKFHEELQAKYDGDGYLTLWEWVQCAPAKEVSKVGYIAFCQGWQAIATWLSNEAKGKGGDWDAKEKATLVRRAYERGVEDAS